MNDAVRTTGIPIARLHDWRPGDPLNATDLDPPNRAIETILGAQSVAQEVLYPPLAQGGGLPEKFTVETANPGATYAVQADFFYATQLSTGEEHVKIAKPHSLRRTTSENKVRYLSEFRVAVQYTFDRDGVIHNRRRATHVEMSHIWQLQMIWPEYAGYNVVNAQQLGEDGTGVEGVEWEEVDSARVWSVLPLGFLP